MSTHDACEKPLARIGLEKNNPVAGIELTTDGLQNH
jgi:hypothetical protein